MSGGEGSELYRISLPEEYVGLSVDDLSAHLRSEHRATLLAVGRNGHAHVNPPMEFRLVNGDDASSSPSRSARSRRSGSTQRGEPVPPGHQPRVPGSPLNGPTTRLVIQPP